MEEESIDGNETIENSSDPSTKTLGNALVLNERDLKEQHSNVSTEVNPTDRIIQSSQKSVEELDDEIEVANGRKIEAALFLAGKFMTIQELITLTDVNPILLKKILADLKEKYEDSGISIIREGDKWKMDVSEDFLPMVNKLATGSSEFSKAEQETLAMIAYKQPMKQSVLIKIRGNKGYDHVKMFKEMGLVNKKRVGHTSELTLTEKFYNYFHMSRGESLEGAFDDKPD